jgi:hypothetical protein
MGHSPGSLLKANYTLAEQILCASRDATSCRATELNGCQEVPGYNGRFLYATIWDDYPEG